MSIRQTLVVIVVLATSNIAFAQTTETKPPDGQKGAAAGLAPAEILTDTQGVDFGPYIKSILPIIRQNWIIGLPESAYPPIWKAGKDTIDFTILKNGKVTGMVWHSGSGSIDLDRAAWGSIIASDPLPPLPKEFPGPNIGLRLNFYLNLEIGNRTGISAGQTNLFTSAILTQPRSAYPPALTFGFLPVQPDNLLLRGRTLQMLP